MLYWRGKRVAFTNHAQQEMMELYWDEGDLRQILEEGRESRKRKEGIIELELPKGDKMRKAVIAESFQYHSKELVWLVIRAGEYLRRRL